MSEKAIEVRNLEKVYTSALGRQKVRAIEDISFEVARGEVFGLLGANGAGKTTTVKILLDLTRATRGEAYVLGRSTREPESRRRVGYLPEGHRFPNYLTARATLGIFGKMSGMSPGEVRVRTPLLLEEVGIEQWADMKVKKFSKGMTQRLGLATAMIHDPDVLFLDEPTDGVDPVGRREIRDILQAQARAGKTIFLNSHLLSEIELMCDRVAMLRGGRIAAIGSVDQLTSGGSAYRLVATQMERVPAALTADGAEYLRQNGHFVVTVDGAQHLNRLIDRLRASEVELLEVTPMKSSLEDVFVDLVRLDKIGASEVKR